MSPAPRQIPSEVVHVLAAAERVAVLTGAGVSAESGVPTFRDALTGLWAKHDPVALATPEAFARDPKLVWDFYAWRRDLVGKALPNAGHHALARLERHVPHFTLITQNVDGLHARAGSRHILELHGSLLRIRCHDCNRQADVEAASRIPDGAPVPPRCTHCGGRLRPDVVWFGEPLPQREIRLAIEAAREADVFLSIGTSNVVHPAASLAATALRGGALVVEINPEPTPFTSEATFVLPYASGIVLPEVVDRLEALDPKA